MATPATYVSSIQFTVSGDETSKLKANLRLQFVMGVDGIVEGTVDTYSYDGGSGLTTVTILESVLTSNLTNVNSGYTYADPSNSSSNLGPHGHSAGDDGGYMVDSTLQAPSGGDAKKIIRVNAAEDGLEMYDLLGSSNQLVGVNNAGDEFESKDLLGTTNQVTVTDAVGSITLATPQDLHTGATVEFADLTTGALTIGSGTGMLVIASGVVSASNGSSAHEVYKRNAANDGNEWALLALEHLSNVEVSVGSAVEGDLLIADSDGDFTVLAIGTSGQVPRSNGTTLGYVDLSRWNHLDDVNVSHPGTEGELFYRDGTGYIVSTGAPPSDTHFLGVSGGLPAWELPPSGGSGDVTLDDILALANLVA